MGKSSRQAEAELAAIVLAAGGSRRLGAPKQLLRLKTEPLILRAARLAGHATGGRVIVVLGAERQRLRSLLQRRAPEVAIVNNARWADGMAGSLRLGLTRMPPASAAALIMVVDQAGLVPQDLVCLVRRWRRHPGRATAARYAPRSGGPAIAGVPAIIPRRLFGAVRMLRGNHGARQLLRHSGEISLVDMPAAAFDIDTPADAAALAQGLKPPG